MQMKNAKLFNLQLSPSERKKAGQLAKRHGVSVAEVFRQGLKLFTDGKASIQKIDAVMQRTGTE